MKLKKGTLCCAVSMLMAAAACCATISAPDDWLLVFDDGDRSFAVGENVDAALEDCFFVDSGSAATITVSGLPTGVRYNAKTQRLSGRTTRTGVSYVTCSARNKNGYQMSATVRWVVGGASEGDYDNIGLSESEDDWEDLDWLFVGDPVSALVFEISLNDTTFSVSGLPAGLKWSTCGIRCVNGVCDTCVPSLWIYGTPTKAGKYRMTFTNAARRKTVKTVIVQDSPCLYQKVAVSPSSAGRGTVSGSGVKKPGSTVRISARPTRGNYFAGWYVDEDCTEPFDGEDVDYRKASLSYVLLSETDADMYAKFVTKNEDSHIAISCDDEWRVQTEYNYAALDIDVSSVTEAKLSVKGLPAGIKLGTSGLYLSDKTKLKPGSTLVTLTAKNLSGATATKTVRIVVPNVRSYVFSGLDYEGIAHSYTVGESDVCYLPWRFSVEEGWSVSASGLPPGLKFSYDKEGNECWLSGMATKAGLYTVTLTAKNGRLTEKATFTVEVKPFPSGAVGTYGGVVGAVGVVGADLPSVDDSDLSGVYGTISVTVAANGKCSAKIVSMGKTYSFSGYSCSVEESEEGGVVTFGFYDDKKGECFLDLTWSADETVARLSGCYDVGNYSFGEISGASLKALSNAGVASIVERMSKRGRFGAVVDSDDDYAGYLECPECIWGSPTLFFTVNKNGTIRSSGKIGNWSVSGSSVLRVSGTGEDAVLFADFYDYKANKGSLVYRVRFDAGRPSSIDGGSYVFGGIPVGR